MTTTRHSSAAEQSPSAPSPSKRRRELPAALLLAAAGIVALTGSALLVVALPRPAAEYTPGTPEASFQAYYLAWEAGDLDRAYGFFSASVRSSITLATYRRRDGEAQWQRDEEGRVLLLDVEVAGDRAQLRVRIDRFYPGGLGGSRYSHEQTVNLVREGGVWLIDDMLIGVNLLYGY